MLITTTSTVFIEISILPSFLRFFDYIMKLFRQCKIYCFSFSYHQLLNCINWCNLFSPLYGWKFVHLALNNNRPLTHSLYQSCNYKVYFLGLLYFVSMVFILKIVFYTFRLSTQPVVSLYLNYHTHGGITTMSIIIF